MDSSYNSRHVESERNLRKIAESDLADSEEIFKLLVDAVEDYAIFVLDPNGCILTWNTGARRLKGYEAGEIIGSHFSRFYTPEDIARNHPAEELKIAIREGKYEEEGWRLRKDGSRFWASVTITALRTGDGELRGFGKVTRDLTERKKAEEDLRDAYADLETRIEQRTHELSVAVARAEEAVRTRDEFFSMASHELKTPLSSLKLQAQIRRRSLQKERHHEFTPEKLKVLFEEDERQVERLNFLVDNMLDVSRIASGNFELAPETFDLGDMVRDVVKRMEPILRQSENEIAILAEEKAVGAWDRHRLEQVLTNLLANAGKYAPGAPVEVGLRADGRTARLCVKDRGRGIPLADQARIFAPFERVKEQRGTGGLGLGLYISKKIVEAHQGRIWVESEPGQGSAFHVTLPFRQNSHEGDGK